MTPEEKAKLVEEKNKLEVQIADEQISDADKIEIQKKIDELKKQLTAEPAKTDPEPDPEPEPDNDDKDGLLNFDPPKIKKPEPTGNADIDAIANSLYENGFDPADVAKQMKANEGNIPEALEAKLKEKYGANYPLLTNQINTVRKGLTNKIEETATMVYEFLGDGDSELGKATWAKVKEWHASGHSGLTDEGKQEFLAEMNAGGVRAQNAALRMKTEMTQSNWFKENGSTAVNATGSNKNTDPNTGLITKDEFDKQYSDAVYKGDKETQKKLEDRRSITIKWELKNEKFFTRN